MPQDSPNLADTASPSPVFGTTHWSIVLEAQGHDDQAATKEALDCLCRTYWYPIYAYVRRRGVELEDAKDLVQGFFAQLLERDFLSKVDASKGKFRSFLLSSMKYYLTDEWRRVQSQKRGGHVQFVSIDEESAEGRYRLEPTHEMSPDRLYERRWVDTLMELVLKKLRDEFNDSGKVNRFQYLKAFLLHRQDASYGETANQLGISEPAVKSLIHRLRSRFRELLHAEIAHTVSSPTEVEDEIRHIFSIFSN